MRWISFFLLLSISLHGEKWTFSTQPSSFYEQAVGSDWRDIEAIEVEVRLKAVPETGAKPIFLNAFLKSHKGWWFEAVDPLQLNGEKQTIYLRLDRESPDWQTHELVRPFGTDILRWLDSWGLRAFSEDQFKGEIKIGRVKLHRTKSRSYEVSSYHLPQEANVGTIAPIQFRLHSAVKDPFNSERIQAHLIWEQGEKKGRVPAHYRQSFVTLHPPTHAEPSLLPFELPTWQANWVPEREGVVQLSLEYAIDGRTYGEDLGSVTVEQAIDQTPVHAKRDTPHLQAASPLVVFNWEGSKWTATSPQMFWRMPMDWIYTSHGQGEFAQEPAWELEQEIASTEAPHPILLVDDSEIDDQGGFSWTSLKKWEVDDYGFHFSNGERPTEWKETKRLLVNRARYLWARYGHYSQVSGLLIAFKTLPLEWVAELIGALPDVPIMSTHPRLYPQNKVRHIDLGSYWQLHPDLGNAETTIKQTGSGPVLSAQGPGSVSAMASATVQHWADAELFLVDVRIPKSGGEWTKVHCRLMTRNGRIFQSGLHVVDPGKWTRLIIPLDDPDQWRCEQDSEAKLTATERLNIKEVALEYFVDNDQPIALTIGPAELLLPLEPPPLAISDLTIDETTPLTYEKVEFDFLLSRSFHNPYDPREIEVRLEATTPSGRVILQPGFYYEPWAIERQGDQEVMTESGTPSWKVRFSPMESGTYNWRLIVKSSGEEVEKSGSLTANASDHHGFIRSSKTDPRYFEYDDGTLYYPIGFCTRSPCDQQPRSYSKHTLAAADRSNLLGCFAYEEWFQKMSQNGINFSRIWMSPWWLGLEWNATYPDYHGLGYYNQKNAARLDQLLAWAEEYGIKINLDLLTHGQLSSNVSAEWLENPLCKAQPGGIVDFATEAFENEEAIHLHKQRQRYMAARWGHSSSLFFWGVSTEVEWMEPFSRALSKVYEDTPVNSPFTPRPYRNESYRPIGEAWLADVTRSLRKHDGHSHPTTVQYSWVNNGKDAWQNDDYEVIYNNAYTTFATDWERSGMRGSKGVAESMYLYENFFTNIKKPVLLAEWGGHYSKNKESHLIAELHTGTWTSFMIPLSGSTGYWWHNLVDARDLFHHLGALAKYAAGEELRGQDLRTEVARHALPNRQRSGFVLANTSTLYGYLFHDTINHTNSSRVANGWDDDTFPESGEGALFAPDQMENGSYLVEYWNTFTGDIVGEQSFVLSDESREIPVMNHRVDLALKVRKA